MNTIRIEPKLSVWRQAVRGLLAARVPPAEIVFDDGSHTGSLFTDDLGMGAEGAGRPEAKSSAEIRIPKAFMQLAELVACHREIERWGLLYQAAYRIHNGERHLLRLPTDPLVRQLEGLAKEISRDRHKMKAFVRFRKVGEDSESGREQFVAWFEPTHLIVELTAPFFAKRFASFDWSILTPDCCAHWDGKDLSFSEGAQAIQAPQGDELEDYWRTYYASIFNPARLKLKAMQSEMPKKYWKNLPEAPLIAELTAKASHRALEMVAKGPNLERQHVSDRVPAGAQHADTDEVGLRPEVALSRVDELSLRQVDEAAVACRHCPLYESATQTVFGEGPPSARIMLIGGQPGDQEDITGRPFVGAVGRLLEAALAEAGLRREDLYLTTTVKHFKSTSRGRKRFPEPVTTQEAHHCKPWVLAEIQKVQPEVVVLLGAVAEQALLDSNPDLQGKRGLRGTGAIPLARQVIVSVDLEARPESGSREFRTLVEDLRQARAAATG